MWAAPTVDELVERSTRHVLTVKHQPPGGRAQAGTNPDRSVSDRLSGRGRDLRCQAVLTAARGGGDAPGSSLRGVELFGWVGVGRSPVDRGVPVRSGG